MPTVPEPLPPPSSLGGLLNYTEDDASEDSSITSLADRASEMTEDIEERQELVESIEAINQELQKEDDLEISK
jgi:hypothetical protein